MGGKGSGRRAFSVEERIHHLRDKAVETTLEYLNSNEPLSERAKIAAQHSVREITDKQENKGSWLEQLLQIIIEKTIESTQQ